MIDKLVNDTAEFWLSRGGDAEGILWSWRSLYEEVKKREMKK